MAWIHEAYALYDSVWENLLLHNSDYPSVEFLKSITLLGNEDPKRPSGGAQYADSEGSDLIVEEILKPEA